MLIRNNGEIIRIKHFSSQENDGFFNIKVRNQGFKGNVVNQTSGHFFIFHGGALENMLTVLLTYMIQTNLAYF